MGFNTTVMLEVPRETVRQRLIERWIQHAKSAEQIALQVDSNDMINVDLVRTASRAADYCIRE